MPAELACLSASGGRTIQLAGFLSKRDLAEASQRQLAECQPSWPSKPSQLIEPTTVFLLSLGKLVVVKKLNFLARSACLLI